MKIENCVRSFRGNTSQCDPSLCDLEFVSIHDVATFLVQSFISNQSNPSERLVHAYLDNRRVLHVTQHSYLVTYCGNFDYKDYERGIKCQL